MLKIKQIREVIRTAFVMPNASANQIAKLTHCSHQSVGRIIKKAILSDLTHPVAAACSDSEITQLLYPSLHDKVGSKRDPDYIELYKQSLKAKGKGK